MDDVYIIVSNSKVTACFDAMKLHCPQMTGLRIRLDKCKALATHNEDLPAEVTFAPSGIPVLGSPVGEDDYCKQYISEKLAESKELLVNIQLLKKQYGMTMLRDSFNHTLGFLIRTVPPSQISHGAAEFDKLVSETKRVILNLEDADADNPLFDLPLSMGGFGLRKAAEISPLAYFSSIAQCSSFLQDCQVSDIQELKECYDFVVTLNPNESILPLDFQGFQTFYSSFNFQHCKLQQYLSKLLCTQKRDDILTTCNKPVKARLSSLKSKGSSAWLKTKPNSKNKRFSDSSFELACKFRCGIQIHQRPDLHCVCGNRADPYGHHFMSCPRLKTKTTRHNLIVQQTSSHCSRAGISNTMENHYPGGRVDISFFNLDELLSHADVSVTHPLSKTYLDGAAAKAGSAAECREKRKADHYANVLPAAQNLYPLVMESYGFIAPVFRTFLQRVSTAFERRFGEEGLVEFKVSFLDNLSCALQQGNALILEEGLRRAI